MNAPPTSPRHHSPPGLLPSQSRLYLRTLASALSCMSTGDVTLIEMPDREPSPAAQREAVTARLREVAAQLESSMRRTPSGPSPHHPALLGALLTERGEKIDPATKQYVPGPGFDALIKGLLADTINDQISAALEAGVITEKDFA